MSLSKETEVIFDEHRGVDYDSANPPLYDSSTFHQKVLGGNAKFDYARSGNPNRQLLEEKLAKLEGGQYAFAYLIRYRSNFSSITNIKKQMITSFFLMMYTVVHSDLQNKF